MKKMLNNIPLYMPLTAMLYLLAALKRPLFAPDEYEFAVFWQEFIPQISGSLPPRLPSLVAVLLTAVLVYIWTGWMQLKYRHTAILLYLLCPITCLLGTSAIWSNIDSLCLFAAFTAFGEVMRSGGILKRTAALGILMVTIWLGAVLYRNELYHWSVLLLFWQPYLALSTARHLEHRHASGLALLSGRRFAFIFAAFLLAAAAYFIFPYICDCLDKPVPKVLFDFHDRSEPLYLQLPALLLPVMWLFLAAGCRTAKAMFRFSATATWIFLLLIPVALPDKLKPVSAERLLERQKKQILDNNYRLVADRDCSALAAYMLNRPVQTMARQDGGLAPEQFSNYLKEESTPVMLLCGSSEFFRILPVCDIQWSDGQNYLRFYQGGSR